MKVVDPNPIIYQDKINLSIIFSFYKYCLNPIEVINRIVQSNKYSISIKSIHDIVPSIIKTGNFYNTLKQLHFIKCSKKYNILNQILEVNYILYKKYFPFHKRHINLGNKILHLYERKCKVGVHVRLNDSCLKSCAIDIKTIYVINNLSKSFCKNNNFIFLSAFNNKFTNLFMKINRNTFSFNSNYIIKHTNNYNNFNQIDIDKIVLDINLISNTDFLLLSGYSTFSLLILYKGFYKDYEKCYSKYYYFWNNGEVYDQLETFRQKYNCKKFPS